MTVAMQVNKQNCKKEEPAKKKRKKQIEKPNLSCVKTDLKIDLPEWSPDNTNIENLRSRNLAPKGYFELFLMMKF